MQNGKMKLAEEGGMIFDFETGLELAVMCDNSPESPARQMLHAANCHDELLEALNRAFLHIDPCADYESWELARDAIRKATGQQTPAKATGAE